MGNTSEFIRAVQLLLDNVSFDSCTTIQVFEANIRYAPKCAEHVTYNVYNHSLLSTLDSLMRTACDHVQTCEMLGECSGADHKYHYEYNYRGTSGARTVKGVQVKI